MIVAALHINTKIEDQLFFKMLKKVDKVKQQRICAFRKREDAERGLISDLLLRMLIMKRRDMKNNKIFFSNTIHGKPEIKDLQGFHFNLSHSGNWVVCATDQNRIGIDIEEIKNIDLSISENFFCQDEHNDIVNAINPIEKFFKYWTLKESYIKFTGKGLSLPLNAFKVKLITNGISLIEENNTILKNVYLKEYKIYDYKMAVCASNFNFPEFITFYNFQDILDFVECVDSY